jgi:glycerophosphoryl diester phosphodiesterase
MTKYIAHRGYALKKTENTFDAFRFSAGTNCFGIETDVHVTKDGEFVVFHDDSTLRLCGEEYIIEQTSLETLRGLRINKEFQIPTLAEYIEI